MTQPVVIIADPPAQFSRAAAALWFAAGMALAPLLVVLTITVATPRPAPATCPAVTAQGR